MNPTEKGRELAKTGPQKRLKRRGFDIEIVETTAIEGGVEVLARAWKGGKAVGFVDGTVELERFRIFNPPTRVPDENGPILQQWADQVTGVQYERRLREDPQEALIQVIEHTLSVMKGVHGPDLIVPGKRGSTTSTFYAGGGTAVDGRVGNGGSPTWATIRDAASGNDAGAADTSITAPYAGKPIADGNFYVYRLYTLFDTSTLPDTDVISAATYSLYINSKNNADNDGNDYISVVTTAPASNTALANSDYSLVGSTEQHDAAQRKDITSISTGSYTDWTLNSTGIGNISKTGITKFGAREGHDLANDPYAGANGQFSGINVTMSDNAGTTQDPKLVVEHAAAPAGSPAHHLLRFL